MGVLGDGRKKDPSAIEYLALEGGGGKGFAFVGAIEALEDLRVLPVARPDAIGHLQGIAGTSAGAITALLLALGLSSNDIRREMGDRKQIGEFMDDPQPGLIRQVTPKYPDEAVLPIPPESVRSFVETNASKLTIVPRMNRFLRDLLTMGRALFPSMAMFFDQLDTSPSEYVHNVVYEWGFFPGFSVREYFRGLLKKYLPAAYQRVHGRSLPGRTVPEIVGFEDFRAYTGVDFKVFGTNVARQEAHLFSADDTPTFPVAEAVGLSMSLPIIYKPVFVSGFGDGVDGVYVDGGLLNNLPLHAFDQAGSERDPTQDPVSTLPPGMLGLRLSSSGEANLQLAPPQPLAAGDVSFDGLITSASLLFGYLQSFCGTVLSPSEHGQFRSPIEQRQTIDLVCDMLSTLDFLPDQADIEAAIEISKAAVNAYFDVG